MAAKPHALVFPYPAQSHIISLLELSYCLADRGFKVTFLTTKFNHARLLATLSKEHAAADDTATTLNLTSDIRLASIPDGLGPDEDRNDIGRLTEGMMAVMPGDFEDFMTRNDGEDRFTCFVADQTMAWALDIAKKAGLRSVTFFPAAAGMLAYNLSISKLIEDGVIDKEGTPLSQDMFQLSPEMPQINPTQLCWNCFSDLKTKKIFFNYIDNNNKAVSNAELMVCNTFYELEKHVFSYAPNIVPIGPLLSGSRPDKPVGNFWLQDTKCIEWLNKQPVSSVIYVAFGSFTVFDKIQFQELLLGLELTGMSFLWVARPDLTDEDSMNLSDFTKRVGDRARIVGWCPQQQVLSHPSIACFISHCGWNSTLEGVRNGIPFLCWPYFADQFFNQSYICDSWRVGLKMTSDENGIYSKEQIKTKVEELIGDTEIKNRALNLKGVACKSLEKDGSSFANFNSFVDLLLSF